MKKKLSILLISFLSVAFVGYGQDSTRTKNDKPGTPQSLRTADQSPRSNVTIINTNTAPGQTVNHAAPGNNGSSAAGQVIVTDANTGNDKVPTTPITISNTRRDTSVKNSAIRNGVSSTTNPIRNK